MKPPSPKNVTVTCRSIGGDRTQFPGAELRFRAAAYGLLVRQDSLLLTRSSFTHRWEAPGGAFEPWEPIAQGLAREFQEETGQVVTVGALVDFRDDFVAFFNHPFHSLRFFFLVQQTDEQPLTLDAGEIDELDWISATQIENLPPHLITDEDRRLFLAHLSH